MSLLIPRIFVLSVSFLSATAFALDFTACKKVMGPFDGDLFNFEPDGSISPASNVEVKRFDRIMSKDGKKVSQYQLFVKDYVGRKNYLVINFFVNSDQRVSTIQFVTDGPKGSENSRYIGSEYTFLYTNSGECVPQRSSTFNSNQDGTKTVHFDILFEAQLCLDLKDFYSQRSELLKCNDLFLKDTAYDHDQNVKAGSISPSSFLTRTGSDPLKVKDLAIACSNTQVVHALEKILKDDVGEIGLKSVDMSKSIAPLIAGEYFTHACRSELLKHTDEVLQVKSLKAGAQSPGSEKSGAKDAQ